MTNPELLLSNQVCFLFHRIDRAIVARYKPLLEGLGLTYPQYLAMLALWEHKSLTVGQLCDALVLDTGTVSPMIKRLTGLGLIVKQRGSQGDERVVLLSLTGKGRALEKAAADIPRALAACVFESMEEYFTLKPLLETLAQRLEKGCAARQ
ncbi:MAG: MarR family transcriptional regulator [Spirochaetia bacterium]|jgi:DNA-binding MarR family transcriptional regulator|nr:MarR family transcriptional regulator [Spirochaetia bacterium]